MSFFTALKVVDGTTPTIFATVKPASTAAIGADPALVVAISPNNTVGVTQSTSPWVISFTAPQHVIVDSGSTAITGTVAENLTQVAGVVLGATAVTNFGAAPAATAVPGVNASIFAGTTGITATGSSINVNITAGTITAVTAITNALPAGANIIGKTDILGNAGAILDAVVTAATAPANGVAVLSVNNTTPPSLTTGQSVAQQADYVGSVFIKPYRRSQTVTQSTTIASSAATTTILAAQAAGVFADLVQLTISVVPGATADTAFTATLSDGTNSTIYSLDTGALATATGVPVPLVITWIAPKPATTAAVAWTLTLSSATVTVYVDVTAVLQKAS